MPPRRILYCQTVPFAPDETGGTISNTLELCRKTRDFGLTSSVLALELPRTPRNFTRRLLRGKVAQRPSDPPVRRERDVLAAARDICRSGPPDVAVIQLGDLAGLSRIFVEAGVQTLIYLHDIYSLPDRSALPQSPLLHIAVCSSFMVEAVMARIGCAANVVPVCIDLESYRTTSTREAATFINPMPHKGLDTALALAARRPDITFLFVESLALRPREFRVLADRVSLHGNVRLMRRRADVRAIYGRTRLVLMPSQCDEGWGRVVTEAQASGIPALASDAGALPETVGDAGIVVARGAPIGDWFDGLAELWDTPEAYDRYSAAAMRMTQDSAIQPAAVARKFADLIGRIAGGQS